MNKSIINYILSRDAGIHETIKLGEEYEKISDEAYSYYQKLQTILSDEQKIFFEKFVDAQIGQQCESNEEYFKEGVKFGVRFITECLGD